MHPDVWGKKYFKEVLSLVIEYLFNELKFTELLQLQILIIYLQFMVLSRLVFVKEGKLRDYYLDKKDNKFYDALILSFLKSEYKFRSSYK